MNVWVGWDAEVDRPLASRRSAPDPTQSFMRDHADPESGRVFRCYYGSDAPILTIQLTSENS